jgi:hypothetical protein
VDGSNDRGIVERGWDRGELEDALDKELERDIDPGFTDPTLVDGSNDRGFFRGGVDSSNDKGWPKQRSRRGNRGMVLCANVSASASSSAPNSNDHIIEQLTREAENELDPKNWRPKPTQSGNPHKGAWGVDLEQKLYPKLEAIRERSWRFGKEHQVWYTDITVDADGKIVDIKHSNPSARSTGGNIQIDAIKVKRGYVPRVGEKLDVDQIEDMYDLKANRSGTIPRDQRDKLNKLLQSGSDKTRKVKIVHSRYRISQESKYQKLIDNPKFTKMVKYASFLAMGGLILGVDRNVFAMVRPEEHEDELDQVMNDYERILRTRHTADPIQLKLDIIALQQKFSNYLRHFSDSVYNFDLVDLIQTYGTIGK